MGKTVTDLVVQKKNKQRISVYLDDNYAFSLSPFIAARLVEGQKLDEETILRLSEEDDLERAYNMALHYLGYRARSLAEMERYLKGKGFPAACRRTTMERLINNRFLNDNDFAGMWVENRTRMNPKGTYALRQELLEKGIEEDLIDENLNGFNETDAAYDAVKKTRTMAESEPGRAAEKNIRILSLRGFSYETTRDITERALSFIKGEIDGSTF